MQDHSITISSQSSTTGVSHVNGAGIRFDVCTYFEEFLNSLDNLPYEIKHLLSEFKDKEKAFVEINSIISQKQKSLQKYTRTQSSPTSQELRLQEAIKLHYGQALRLSEEKCLLSQKITDLLCRHIKRMDLDLSKVNDEWVSVVQSAIATFQDQDADQAMLLMSLSLQSSVLPSFPNSHVVHTQHPTGGEVEGGADESVKGPARKHRRLSTSDSHRPLSPRTTAAAPPPPPVPPSVQPTTPLPAAFPQPIVPHDPLAPASSAGTASPSQMPLGPVPRMRKKRVSLRDKQHEPRHPTPGVSSGGTSLVVPASAPSSTEDSDDKPYCYCRQSSYGQMIGCDNVGCRIEWFHYECVGLTESPPESWFCKDCRIKLGMQTQLTST